VTRQLVATASMVDQVGKAIAHADLVDGMNVVASYVVS
jgi:hypothetical protein